MNENMIIIPNSEPLANSRHEAFAQEVASGKSGTEAYEAVYGVRGRNVATAAGSRLLRDPKVAARVKSFQTAAAQGVVADLHEIQAFLTRVMRTPVADVDASSDLCERRRDTAHGTDLFMPNKRGCVELLAKLQGLI